MSKKKKPTNYDFSQSKMTRPCRHCGGNHYVVYALFKNRTKHLVMFCYKRRVNNYIPFESDLPIPTELSRKAKLENETLEQTVIGDYMLARGKRTLF